MSSEFALNDYEQEVRVGDKDVQLNGILGLPPNPLGVIVFAHGSGSGRFSPRNNYVARVLQQASLGTLLIDLLSETEASDRGNVFDIALLAERCRTAKTWLATQPKCRTLPVGYFGASTGAGAALVAAAEDPENIFAVVSRGGRPDLAGESLDSVKAPTLLLVGGHDGVVITLNENAFNKLHCTKELKIIPRATHLFEEPGTLEQVAELASAWFSKQIGTGTKTGANN